MAILVELDKKMLLKEIGFSVDSLENLDSEEPSRPSKKLVLGKYEVNRRGELVIDTPEGRFSPIDFVNMRVVKMTKALVDKRARIKQESWRDQEIEMVWEGRPYQRVEG